VRDFLETWFNYGHPETVVHHDSAAFEIVEMNNGNHELYIPGHLSADLDISGAVFPFWRLPGDTVRIYRYASIDPADTLGLVGHRHMFVPSIDYHLLFRKGVGVVRSDGYMGMSGDSRSWLLNLRQVLDSVNDSTGRTTPTHYYLSQNYPNPFNPSTVIAYQLPQSSHVTLTIINIYGQKVATLVDRSEAAGTHTVEWKPNVCSGTYIYRLESGQHVESRKMVFIK
jgi:hypothetical protein